MKKILLTLILWMVALPLVFAQGNRSILNVRLSDNAPIMIRIDKRYYNEQARTITVDNVIPGRHRLKIYLANENGFTNRALVYDGYIRIDQRTFNQLVVDRRQGMVKINTRTIGERDFEERNYPNNNRDEHWNDRNDRMDNHNSFSQKDMDDLRERVANRITDTDKLKLMKSVLNNRTYTTEQARLMLHWLSFDSSKLDFGKWAYNNASDKRNYWKLESEFDFSSSKEEFSEYVNANR